VCRNASAEFKKFQRKPHAAQLKFYHLFINNLTHGSGLILRKLLKNRILMVSFLQFWEEGPMGRSSTDRRS
jgi:hypothetical protein